MATLNNSAVISVIAELALTIFLYGLYLPVAVICFRYLLTNRKRTRGYFFLWIYFSISFSLSSIFTATDAVFKGEQLVCLIHSTSDDAQTECGLVQIGQAMFTIKQTGITALKLNMLVADAMTLYRLNVIWGDFRWVLVIPSLLYLASLAINCYTLFTTIIVSWTIGAAGIIVATVFDFTASTLIAGRLLMRRKSNKSANDGQLSRQYTSLAGVFVESSILAAVTRLTYAIGGRGLDQNRGITWPGIIAAGGASFAPTLIIVRMALNISATRSIVTRPITTLNFARNSAQLSTRNEGYSPVDGQPPVIPLETIILRSLNLGETVSIPHTQTHTTSDGTQVEDDATIRERKNSDRKDLKV